MGPEQGAPASAAFPLTDTQQAYLVGRGDAYPLGNVSTHAYLELEGPLDAGRFVRAWRLLVDRHGMLRTVVDPTRQEQRELAEVPDPPIEVVDLRDRPADEVGAALAAVRERLSHEVRPAGVWPLFSVVVCLLQGGTCRVHVGFDGLTVDWASWHVMYRDLAAYYNDPAAELPPLAGGFADYLRERAAAVEPGSLAAAEEFWERRLPELPDAPALPLRVDPDSVRSPRFVRRESVLDPDTWARLRRRGVAAGLTPTGVVLAAYAEVIARWSATDRFTLNVPSMNRDPSVPGAAGLVGEFASFTLVEADHSAPGGFAERARALQRRLLEGLEHGEAGGVRLLRRLTRLHGGEQARMPVVLTSTLALADPEPHVLERSLRHVYGITQTPQVYLDAQVEERRGSLACNWDAVEELFAPGVLDAMFGAWTSLLRRLADDGELWDRDDVGLLPAEQAARREAAQGAAVPIPDELVQEAFLRQAAARPDAPAVISASGTLGYGALRARAARLARRLRTEGGVEAGALVALLLDKGEDQVVAALAVLLAGGAYVPLDPESPPGRLAALLEAASVAAVVTHAPLAGAVPGGPWAVVRADAVAAAARDAGAEDGSGPRTGGSHGSHDADDSHGSAGADDSFDDGAGDLPPSDRTPDDLAYVLFTSGTTGTPKGVMIEHRGVVNCLRATAERFALGPGDRCLGLTALHHDMSLFDVFGVLGAGGTLVLPEAARRTDPAHWLELMARHRVTVWNSVPAMMEMLLARLADTPGDRADDPATLRLAFLGGDWVPLAAVRELGERFPGARAVSVGGPTETTLWNIWYSIGRPDPRWTSVPYGTPIANTRYHVLDRALRDRPDGVTGELYCSGPGVTRGYLGDEGAGRGAFATHPRTGERLYRSGDLGRYRADGVIEFAGRADGQVQIAGRRVEPAEVEAALAAHPGVARAAVVPVRREQAAGHRGLAAFAVPVPGRAAPDPAELRAHLGGLLPAHLVPGSIVTCASLPLTRNGKVDRDALAREAAATPPTATATAVAVGGDATGGDAGGDGSAADPLVELLARTWASALGLAHVGPHDNFFALGGDSLVGARILARLRDAFPDERLSPRALMATSDVVGMARVLAEEEAEPGRMAQIAAVHLYVADLSPEDLDAALAGEQAPPGGAS
ncbi:putative non-ribosomal peptide synthase [Actinacidiphila reveromycinica]|uniref:Phenyloxazoline synthase MbtB n=1 Tax=Actinacidiphila reveromycinica TaxID=659352 RepID=A0A7U3V0N9_9ACTN|nr:non-ribosomal peptide synthetase [Streptomyces sp. SN-593]BBB02297.1 putative non-ribosomal peptide synthase [Streptomyces sp. SN-593]